MRSTRLFLTVAASLGLTLCVGCLGDGRPLAELESDLRILRDGGVLTADGSGNGGGGAAVPSGGAVADGNGGASVGPLMCSGAAQKALSLDGSGDWVEATDTGLPAGTEPRTVEVWARAPAKAEEQYAVSYGTQSTSEGMGLGFLGGRAVVTQEGDSLQAPATGGVYHHIAFTFDGTLTTLYVDGQAVRSRAMDVNTQLGGTLYVGRVIGPPPKTLSGEIDEVRIWDRALSAAEIQNGMTRPLVGGETGLLVYYDFNSIGDGAGNAVSNRATTGSSFDGVTIGDVTSVCGTAF